MTNYSQKPVEIEKLQPEDNKTQSIKPIKKIQIFKNLHKIAIQDQTMK